MKPKKLTDMDVANVRVSLEDQSPIKDEEIQFETLPEDSPADAIIEVEKTKSALLELAERVETVRDQATLEAYQWAYRAIAGTSFAVETKAISLEGYTGTITRKTALAKAIRAEVVKLDEELQVALETYASDIKDDFADLVKQYGQLNRKLRATDANIDDEVSKKIEVNHTRLFEMFMIKDVFRGGQPLDTIREETTRLDKLVQRVATGVDRLRKDVGKLGEDDKLDRSSRDLPDQNTMQLMFNRKAKVNQGQFETEARKVRGPKKTHSWGQIGWITFGAVLFNTAGANLAEALVGDKKDSEAKVTNSLGDIHKFIRAVEALDDVVDDLSGHVQDLVDLFKQVNENQESALNRRAVPIMELASFTMKQIIDITKGTDTLFTKLVRKHSK